MREINHKARELKLPRVEITSMKKHDQWKIGNCSATVPRHKNISVGVFFNIVKEFEPLLGEGWWRNELEDIVKRYILEFEELPAEKLDINFIEC